MINSQNKVFRRRLLFAFILMLVFALSSCGAAQEEIEKSQAAGIEAEEGWTFGEDGYYSYALVLTNNTDKLISTATVNITAIGADGEELHPSSEGAGLYRIGPVQPGEKAAVCIESWDELWDGTPEKFSYQLSRVNSGDFDAPQLVVTDTERVTSDEEGDILEITIKNNGEEDFDWQEIADNSYHSTKNVKVYQVVRDEEGKITGGREEFLDKYDTRLNEAAEGFPVIPSGGAVTLKDYYSECQIPGDPEYIITFVP